MAAPISLRQARSSDAAAVACIYNHYVIHTAISFETQALSAEEMRSRIDDRLARYDWLVAEQAGEVIGFAYYGQFRARAAYNHVAESTVYVARQALGQRVGERLYRALIDSARARGLREMIGVIALPNEPSEALHQRMGFQPVGRLPRVGWKFGHYIDVSLWQCAIAGDAPSTP